MVQLQNCTFRLKYWQGAKIMTPCVETVDTSVNGEGGIYSQVRTSMKV